MILVFSNVGKCLEINHTDPPPIKTLFEKYGEDIVLYTPPDASLYIDVSNEDITATIVEGVLDKVHLPDDPPTLFIHHDIKEAFTDGPEGTPSVAAGETIQINLTVRLAADPVSSVVGSFTSWLRVPYRINNNEKRFRRVKFVEGLATIEFTPQTNHWGNMSVNEADFVEVGGYRIRLAEPISIDIDEL